MSRKTNAEIQADYRNSRSLAGDTGEQRINTWVSTAAKLALKRLSLRSNISQREILEQLIIQADEETQKGLSDSEFDVYLGITQ